MLYDDLISSGHSYEWSKIRYEIEDKITEQQEISHRMDLLLDSGDDPETIISLRDDLQFQYESLQDEIDVLYQKLHNVETK